LSLTFSVGWTRPREVLDALKKRDISFPCRVSNLDSAAF
jgi:hypothetical protein